jgi:hypothetical protein
MATMTVETAKPHEIASTIGANTSRWLAWPRNDIESHFSVMETALPESQMVEYFTLDTTV